MFVRYDGRGLFRATIFWLGLNQPVSWKQNEAVRASRTNLGQKLYFCGENMKHVNIGAKRCFSGDYVTP